MTNNVCHYCLLAWLALALPWLAPAPATARQPVTLQLKWTHAFQFAGYYAAKEKGFYQEAGLEVKIMEAPPGIDPVKVVLAGEADFGVGTSSLLLQRQAGKPLVVLAAIFQHSPYMLITRQLSPAKGIRDLAGKRVMLEPQAEELLAFLKKEGIALDQLTQQAHSYDPLDLIRNKTDAISAYVINQPYYLDRAGFFYQAYSPRSAGIDFYGDNLFTSERLLKSSPGQVEAFRAASLRGWKYAMAHPEEIADLIIKNYSQAHSRDYYLFQSQQMLPLIQPDLVEIGYMNPGRWRHIADTYGELGLLPHDVSLGGFLYEAQPLRFKLLQLYGYLAGALLMMISTSLLAGYVLRINRRLARIMAKDKETTAALAESEQHWRTIVKTSPDGITITALDGTILQVSDKISAMLGYEAAAEIVGRNLYEFIDPACHAQAASRIDELLNGTYSGVAEYRMIRKDGSRFQAEANGEVLRNGDGGPSELFFVERDISQRKQIEATLRSLSVAIEQSPLSVIITDPNGTIQYVNPRFTEVTGYAAADVIGKNPRILNSGLTGESVFQAMWQALGQGHTWTGEFINRRKDGGIFCEEAHIAPVFDKDGTITQYVAVKLDISERKRTQEELRLSEERHRMLADNASDVIWTMDLEGRFTYVSPSVEKLRGYTAAEVMQQTLSEVLTPESAAIASERLARAVEAVSSGTPFPAYRGELEQPCKDGSTVWTEVTTSGIYNEAGEFVGLLGVTRDISERKQAEKRITHLAQHDPLTDLPNRALFSDRLQQALALAQRDGERLALMFIDLDRFKPVNDTYGHAVGDLMLQEVARRMRECIRASDTVGRIGGDEFVVLLPKLAGESMAILVAEKLRSALAEPFVLAGHTLHISSSIGIAMYPDQAQNELELSQYADLAMYDAKESGRNTVVVFQEEMRERYQPRGLPGLAGAEQG